ncbi:MAG: HNH endonuclease signature motif containing protein [Candidatus Omnitrophota bacterium]|nr:HNH endonuclease signature motif containing protein [Candidatus Omnitrophota bacterium]
MKKTVPLKLLAKLKKITSKRPRVVIEHILKHGFITTEELESKYGYSHPPRAARDVREQGVPLETFRVKGSSGRSIAAYKFGDLSKIINDKLGGRKVFSKDFKNELIVVGAGKCYICLEEFDERYLQIDHRIPYEISTDKDFSSRDVLNYMLLCGSCNRAKSWSCEHCENWKSKKQPFICKSCYWASPEEYTHIGEKHIRRLDLIWMDDDIRVYEGLKNKAKIAFEKLPKHVKEILRKHSENLNP